MPKYQIQYKNNSKTFTDILESSSYKEVIDLFKTLYNAELTEIREIVYEDFIYPKDDGDYIKYVSCFLKGDNNVIQTFKIPKLKKTITDNELENLLKTYIKVNNKVPISFRLTSKI